MIAKVGRGGSFRGLASYLHGPGRGEEHVYAQKVGGAVIAGTVGVRGDREGAGWAATMGAAQALRPEITKPVWHASFRAAPGDRELSDAQWRDVAQEVGEAMGWSAHPWVAVRHGVDHIHVVVSRVDFEGKVWHGRQDYAAAMKAMRAVEDRYKLQAPQSAPARADARVSSGEWQRGQRTGVAPERVVLATKVAAAVDAAAGQGRAGFEAALERAGVEHRETRQRDRAALEAIAEREGVAIEDVDPERVPLRTVGYSFHLPAHTRSDGEAVWFRASQLNRALSWAKVAPVLDGPAPEPTVAVASRGLLESRAHHEQRKARAETGSRQAGVALVAQQGVRAADQWWQARQEQAGAGAAARALARQRATAPAAPAAPVVEPDAAAAIAARSFPTDLSQALTARARARAQQATPQGARQVTEQGARAPHRPRQDPGRTKGPSQGR